MKYTIHQIVLTDADVEAINDGKIVAKFDAQCDAIVGRTVDRHFYEAVATIETVTDLGIEEVFNIGNEGHEQVTILDGKHMHSITVGDILEDESGNYSVVAFIGFHDIL